MPLLEAGEGSHPALELDRAAAELQPDVGAGQDDIAVEADLHRSGSGTGGEDPRLSPKPPAEDAELEAVAIPGSLGPRGTGARHQPKPRATSAPPARPSPRPTKVAAIPGRSRASSQPGLSRRGMAP